MANATITFEIHEDIDCDIEVDDGAIRDAVVAWLEDDFNNIDIIKAISTELEDELITVKRADAIEESYKNAVAEGKEIVQRYQEMHKEVQTLQSQVGVQLETIRTLRTLLNDQIVRIDRLYWTKKQPWWQFWKKEN